MQKENWNRSQRLDKKPKMPGKVQKEKKHRIQEKSGKEPERTHGRGNPQILRPRLPVINYVIPDSVNEDLEENSEVTQLGHLCTSEDPTWVGQGWRRRDNHP